MHTEWRSKASIYTSQSSGGTRTRKVLPELPLLQQRPGMRALSRPSYPAGPLNLIGAWNVIMAKRMTSSNRYTENHLGGKRVRLAGARTLPDTGGGEPRTPTRGPSIEHGARPSTHRGPGVTSCPAVVAEVIVRHALGQVLLTEYGSPWESRSSPAPDAWLIPHRRGVSRCAQPGTR